MSMILQKHHHDGLGDIAHKLEGEFTDTNINSSVCCHVQHYAASQILQLHGLSKAGEHLHVQRVLLTSLVPLWSVPQNWSHNVLSINPPVVPASSDRMLEKSLNLGAPPDVVIYDLEDSVTPTPHDKKAARQRLSQFLHVCGLRLDRGIAVLM